MPLQQQGWTHAYVDFFVEPLKKWLPWEVWFWRPDQQRNISDGNFRLFVWDRKPLGYWLGHLVAYVLPVLVIWGIYELL